MTPALAPMAIGLLGFCVLAETGRELGFKIAAQRASAKPRFAFGLMQEPLLYFALALGAVEIVVWILVLQQLPLAIAYPIISLVYVAVPLAGVLILRERLSLRQVGGCLLIASGAACVGLSGG